jgi:hypothetical protein
MIKTGLLSFEIHPIMHANFLLSKTLREEKRFLISKPCDVSQKVDTQIHKLFNMGYTNYPACDTSQA